MLAEQSEERVLHPIASLYRLRHSAVPATIVADADGETWMRAACDALAEPMVFVVSDENRVGTGAGLAFDGGI